LTPCRLSARDYRRRRGPGEGRKITARASAQRHGHRGQKRPSADPIPLDAAIEKSAGIAEIHLRESAWIGCAAVYADCTGVLEAAITGGRRGA
jgi:hypothetical protein